MFARWRVGRPPNPHALFKAIRACCNKGAPCHHNACSEECLYRSRCLRMGGAVPPTPFLKPSTLAVSKSNVSSSWGMATQIMLFAIGGGALPPTPRLFVPGHPCLTAVCQLRQFFVLHDFHNCPSFLMFLTFFTSLHHMCHVA